MSDQREKGIRFFGEVLGRENEQDYRDEVHAPSHFGSETARFSADFAFGTIWEREGLERKQRSLVVMGILIALRQTEELKYHVRVALSNGLSVKEIEEVLYQSIPYAGFPAANSAKIAMTEALRDLGYDIAKKPAA
jgi:alkylhydroperoxidase/carboxymuconolactone decarboxylase family protein YurZ